jgi:predicted ATP-grasp superfamily ATP-dependent carboligase
LVLAVSARAICESARRAGYETRAVDAFGDLDLIRSTSTIALARESGAQWSARAAAVAARGIECDGVVYGSGFENHPAVVRALATIAPVIGNSFETLRRSRDPIELARVLTARGYCVPNVSETPPASRGVRDLARRRWLRKPRASGGGHGIASWRSGIPLAPRMVLQERVSGIPGSIVFAANGSQAVPLAISRQLIGDRQFGAVGFRYAGNILEQGSDDVLFRNACELARGVTEEFGLVGVNGVDFVAREDVPWVIEVNPRFSASMELAERAYGVPVFDIHVRACSGELPDFDLSAARAGTTVHGKAVLYARRTSHIGDSTRWLEEEDLRDIPHPDETISKGRPICTVFAHASSAAACRAALARRATEIYGRVERGGREE